MAPRRHLLNAAPLTPRPTRCAADVRRATAPSLPRRLAGEENASLPFNISNLTFHTPNFNILYVQFQYFDHQILNLFKFMLINYIKMLKHNYRNLYRIIRLSFKDGWKILLDRKSLERAHLQAKLDETRGFGARVAILSIAFDPLDFFICNWQRQCSAAIREQSWWKASPVPIRVGGPSKKTRQRKYYG